MNFNFKKNIFLLATACAVVVSCSTGPEVQDFPVTANPSDEILGLQSKMKLAHEKQYLISNSENQSLAVQAIGYDYQKPLATNKTAIGRAKNRRVDIIITANNK